MRPGRVGPGLFITDIPFMQSCRPNMNVAVMYSVGNKEKTSFWLFQSTSTVWEQPSDGKTYSLETLGGHMYNKSIMILFFASADFLLSLTTFCLIMQHHVHNKL